MRFIQVNSVREDIQPHACISISSFNLDSFSYILISYIPPSPILSHSFSPLIKPIHSFPLFLFILLCYPYFVVFCCCFVSLILQIYSCHIAMVSHLLLLAALMSQFSKLRLFFSSSFDLEKVFLYFVIEKCMFFDCLFCLISQINNCVNKFILFCQVKKQYKSLPTYAFTLLGFSQKIGEEA